MAVPICFHSEESLLTPIVSCLTGLAKESRDIRKYIKTAVFQEAAQASPAAESKQQNTSADITPSSAAFTCPSSPTFPTYLLAHFAALSCLCCVDSVWCLPVV